MTNRPAPTTPLLRDVEADRNALAFWGVVSGRVPLKRAMNFRQIHCSDSALAWELRDVLQGLVVRGVLDPRTEQPAFDADRRCRDCGVIHADHPLVARTGKCLRQMFGGPPALGTDGLRRSSTPARTRRGRR